MGTRLLVRSVILAVVIVAIAACVMPAQALFRPLGNSVATARGWATAEQPGALNAATVTTLVSQLPKGELTTAESDALLFMREEEKLAHDVYVTLAAQWQLPIFQNIANSETTHTAAIKVLLDRYGLTDPVGSNGVGIFTNGTLQTLYDQLVADGSQSLAAALRVGATIEDLDIVDLQQRLAQTDNADLELVFNHLTSGSHNHLRAFVRMLEQQTGESYQPQYLDQATYDDIIDSDPERGSGPGRGRNGR